MVALCLFIIDGYLSYFSKRGSNNFRRALTGILGGAALTCLVHYAHLIAPAAVEHVFDGGFSTHVGVRFD